VLFISEYYTLEATDQQKESIMKYLQLKWWNVIVYLQHAEDWYLQDLLTSLDM
jgi:hypothetical protein